MIELNSKTRQDFLNREWVQKLLDAGVDMSDAKYCICKHIGQTELKGWFVYYRPDTVNNCYITDIFPTYTVSELLYKLHEWIYPTINGKKFSGGLKFLKDAPFYTFYYDLRSRDYDRHKLPEEQSEEWDESFIGEAEYPIESLASLLIQCHQRDIGIVRKDTGDISDK